MFKERKINKILNRLNSSYDDEGYDSALFYCEMILDIDSKNQCALYKKALILYDKCEYEESLSVLDHLLSIDYCIDAFLLKGRVYCNLNDYENSLNSYKEASINFDLDKMNNEMTYYASHPSLFDKGIHTKIFIDLCNIILDNADIIEVRLFKSYVLSEIGRSRDALNNVNYILAHNPNNEKAISLKSSILISLNHFDEALALINEGLNLYPNNLQLIDTKARLYYALSDYDEALEICKEYNSMDDFGNYYLLSKIEYKKGDYSLALKNIDIALDKFFKNPNFDDKKEFSHAYYWYKSLILSKLDRFDEANKICDCLIEKEESAKNYCLKSMILFKEGNYTDALIFIDKALELDCECDKALELKNNIEDKLSS